MMLRTLTIMHFFPPPQIYYYADSIYASAGVKQNDIQYVTVGTGAVNVFMTIAAVSTLWNLSAAVVSRTWRGGTKSYSLLFDHASRRQCF